ncbi:MAG: Ig-like domain-containing protein [Bacteroidales bacterium]|nr:Ig-like domain-containing protein [Bacteroidales bacterium]
MYHYSLAGCPNSTFAANDETMKRYIVTVMVALVAVSCVHKEQFSGGQSEGGRTTLYFNYQSKGALTKVLAVNDSFLSNVNILIYNSSGLLVHSSYSDNGGVGSIRFTTFDGETYKIYCLANMSNQALNPAFIRESALLGYKYPIASYGDIADLNGAVPMCFVSEPLSLRNNMAVNVALERCVSAVTVSFDKSLVPEGTQFNIVSAKLKNIPSSVRLFGESATESTADVLSEGDRADATDLALLNAGLQVSYYLFENKHGNLISDNTLQSGKCFAPGSVYNDLCTYFEFEVEYRDAARYGTNIYRFFLGEDNVGNFDIARNKRYDIVVSLTEEGMNENSWRVDVSDLGEFVSSITLEGTRKRIMMDETLQLSASVAPSTAKNTDVIWICDNPGVATVSQTGLVTPVSYGTASITAVAADGSGVSETTSVIVSQNLTRIVFRPPNQALSYDETFQTSVVAYYGTEPDTLDRSLCTFSSDNTSACTIDEQGVIHCCMYNDSRVETRVRAQYQGYSASMSLIISARLTQTVAYPTVGQTVTVGTTIHMQLLQRYNNGYSNLCEMYGTNLGHGVAGSGFWYSDDPSVATCTPEGDVVAVGKGVTTIRGIHYYNETYTATWQMGIIVK